MVNKAGSLEKNEQIKQKRKRKIRQKLQIK